nr:VCBS repeat-containing protein [Myxococcota bacterium]
MLPPVRIHPRNPPRFALRSLLANALLVAAALPTSAADQQPFQAVRLPVPGRLVEVWTGSFTPECKPGAQDILGLTIEGVAPHERRKIVHFPCTDDLREGSSQPREFPVGADVVAVDSLGDELLLLTPGGLAVVSLAHPERRREISPAGGLPLVPRTRGLSRIPMTGPWGAGGTPAALLPTLEGALVVGLADGEAKRLVLPIEAEYTTQSPGLPDPSDPYLSASIAWPMLQPGDDDGDGRTDLYAFNRWTMAVYRSGDNGLPTNPTRKVELRPFEDNQELRPEQSRATYRAIDINRDGLTDLVFHRSWGSLMRGRADTRIYLNRGDGPRPERAPDAHRELKDGFSSIEFLDLDGEGWLEGVETSIRFGLVQAVRMLVTRSGKATLNVLSLDPDQEPHPFVSAWEKDVRFKIDFNETRIEGLYPILRTDWNGDGLNDFLAVDDGGSISLRLGEL